MKVWLITDTHFHHEAMIRLCGRPENYTELIRKNWLRLIAADDLVIHLGDVTFKRQTLRDELNTLPGCKILIRGNHDSESLTWYMRNGFALACDSMVFKMVLLTHAPANELPGNAVLNVHGHLHRRQHHQDIQTKPFNRLLSLEEENYKPVDFDKFVGKDIAQRKIVLV